MTRIDVEIERWRGDAFRVAACAVVHAGEIVHRSAHGCDLETRFDLASVTKAATSYAIARDLLDGRIPASALDDRVILAGAVQPYTPRQLLAHTSGLPAWAPLFEDCLELAPRGAEVLRREGRTRILARIAATACATPGSLQRYSDLGFLALGAWLEQCDGYPLRAILARWLPALRFGPIRGGAAATEIVDHSARPPAWPDPVSSAAPLHRALMSEVGQPDALRIDGVVHDENAAACGGIASHAGLFAHAGEALELLLAWREIALEQRGDPWIDPFITPAIHAPGGAPRTLGLDARSGAAPSSGAHFGARTIGHLGFTGTSLWWDPEADLGVVLLTNRVFDGRDHERIRDARPAIHDAIWKAVIG